jgi:hypothetical protein
MTTYASHPCLTIEPNLVTERDEKVSRAVESFANENGNVVTQTTDAPPVSAFTLEWGCVDRAALNTLTDFLDSLNGQVTPCWIPTYQRDLYVTSIDFFGHWFITPGASPVTSLITAYPSLRHWTAYGGAVSPRHFSYRGEVVDVGSGVYELKAGGSFIPAVGDSVVSTDTSASGVIFSRAMLCRMASDAYTARILGKASTVSADFIEVPAEAPAV